MTSLPIPLAPTESSTDKVGFGHFPLLEAVGTGDVHLPDPNILEEQMTHLLRACHPPTIVSLAKLQEVLASSDAFQSLGLGKIPREWPEYRGPVDVIEDDNDIAG